MTEPDELLENLPPVRAFGEWDAPITDDAEWIDVPTDFECVHCSQRFREGDNGAMMPMGYPEHRECGFRATQGGIGHMVDHARYCGGELGPDAGLTRRQSSWLVWRLVVERHTVAEETLAMLRAGEAILCERCGWTSHHPIDVAEGYCQNCRAFTGRA